MPKYQGNKKQRKKAIKSYLQSLKATEGHPTAIDRRVLTHPLKVAWPRTCLFGKREKKVSCSYAGLILLYVISFSFWLLVWISSQ